MADRTVKVTLTAVASQYISEFKKAQAQTSTTTKAVTSNLDKQKAAMSTVGHAALLMGTVAAAGLAYVVKTTADFDAQMAQVQSLSHATAGQMNELRDAALEVGQKFGYSATQVAEAETELVKAGISVKDQMGGALTGALTLAADGQMNVADATQIAAEAMTQFGLKGKDVPHIADLLAAGADKALGSVGDLGNALESGGLVAAQFGLSIDDTVGTLSSFAQAGLLGESAGTDLRQMLLKLASPSAESASTMKDLGIQVYNAQGKFVGITDLAGQLKDKLSGLSQAQRDNALSTIFGSRAIQGANVLYKEGSKGIQGWIDKVNDQGFAASQAQGKLNSLNGDIQKLGAAFQTSIIKSGGGANDVLRTLVKGVTGFITAIGNVPAPILAIGVGITALVAGVGLLGGGFLTLVPKIAATKAALADLNLTGKSLAISLAKGGGIALGITAIASGLANMGSAAELSSDQLSDVNSVMKNLSEKNLTGLFKGTGDAILDTLKGTAKLRASLDSVASSNIFVNKTGLAKFVDGTTFGLTHLSDAAKQTEAQFKQMGASLGATAKTDLSTATDSFNKLVKQFGGGKDAVKELLQEMPDYKSALTDLATAQGITLTNQQLLNLAQGKGAIANQLSATSTKNNDAALSALSDTADDADGKIQSLSDTINNFGKGALDVSSATIQFNQSVADATTAVAQNGKTLDESTQKGRDNQTALDGIAKSALGLASSQATAGDSVQTLTATVQTGRNAFIKSAEQMGLTSTAANALADKYGLIPANVSTTVKIVGSGPTLTEIQNINTALASITRSIDVSVSLHGAGNLATTGGLKIVNANGNILDFYANGGESHTAQISAGVTRVWAEPETGGEAYIPLSPAKRGRSLSIWETVGKRLGVQGFADGGMTTFVSSPFGHSSGAPGTPAPSLEGAVFQASVDGIPFRMEIQKQIAASNYQRTLKARRG